MTAPDRRKGENVLVFPEADDKLSFFQNSSWSDFGSAASKDFLPQMPKRQGATTARSKKPRRRSSMIETYGSHSHSELFGHSHSELFGSSSSHEDVFGSDLMAADPWVDFKDEFGMSRDDSFNVADIISDSSEGDFDRDEEEQFTLHFPSAEAARGEGTMPLRDHHNDDNNSERNRSRGRQGRRSPKPPANEGSKRRNRSRSKPSFVAPTTQRRTRSLSVPKKASVIIDQQGKSSSSHSRKIPTESLPTAKSKKNRSEEKSRKTKGDKTTKAPKAPSDKSQKTQSEKTRKASKASKDKSLKGSKDKSQKTPKASSDKSPKISKDKSAKSIKVSRSKSPKFKAPLSSRSKSPKVSRDGISKSTRSKSPMAARDRSSKTTRSKSPMAARDKSSKPSRSKSPMAARDRSSKTSRDRFLKANSEDKSLKSIVTDTTLPQVLRKPNVIGTEKKKGHSLFASPFRPKSYLSRGTQKRCYAGFSKESDDRLNNIKESLANLLCDDEESVHSSTERKRSSSVPRRSGSESSRSEKIENLQVPTQRHRRHRRHSIIGSSASESSRSEQIENLQVPTQRHRRYRRHSIIGSSPSDVAKRVPATMTRPRSAEMLMSR